MKSRILLLVASCALSFLAGLYVRQAPVEHVSYQSVYIPAFIPLKETRYANEQRDRIAAQIPASALRVVEK